MTAKEFFERVKKSLRETEGNDPVGVAFFLQDMEKLLEEWEVK